MTKRLLFVTGTRADFGKLEPLAQAAFDTGYDISFFVTGMHMLEQYGKTVREVQRFEGAQCHEYINQRHGDPQDVILAKTVQGFSDWIHEETPDLVLVHGDRIEALSAALVCSINYIPCVHIEGGEVSGTIDEIYRHCNSKLCSYHFVSSQTARKRLLSLGEDPDQIYVLGSPEMDVHKRPSGISIDEVRSYYDIPFDDHGIVLFHPVTSEQNTIGQQAHDLCEALKKSGKNYVVIAPNNDPGCQDILANFNALPKERFRLIPSMRFSYFSTMMKHAGVIVGNSSLGVREAPFLGVPSLNIGTRQHNRAHSPSVTHSAASDLSTIERFLSNEWGNRYEAHTEYGEGRAAERFVEILQSNQFWQPPKQKVFHDQ